MLSVEAVQLRLICEEEMAEAERPVGTDGTVVSAAAGVVALADEDWADTFPAASYAATVYE